MVAIGGCDYCGEFCAQLGVCSVEGFLEGRAAVEWPDDADDVEANAACEAAEAAAQAELDEAIAEHCALVSVRLTCAILEGWEFDVRHVDPLHGADWTRNDVCSGCADGSSWDAGGWDSTLSHRRCPVCWARVGGGALLDLWRRESGSIEMPDTDRDAIAGTTATRTDPADRSRVEAALRAYAGDRLPPVRWVPSPLEVVRTLAPRILELGAGLDMAVSDGIAGWSVRSGEALALEPGRELVVDDDLDDDDEEADHAAGGSTSAESQALTRRDIASHLAWAVASNADMASTDVKLLAGILEDAGQFADPSLRIVASDEGDRAAKAALLRVLAGNAGPVAVLPEEVVVSDRPLVCSIDQQGCPHGETGPAIAYPDGLRAYAWHGVRVPAWMIEEPERLTPAEIDVEQNVEVRRVMVERFGPDRLIRDGGAILVHEDGFGRLWLRAMPAIESVAPAVHTWSGRTLPGRRTTIAEEPIAYVEVQDATPGPDGIPRTYFLRVPPNLRTARDAVAWTFGREGSEYAPDTET